MAKEISGQDGGPESVDDVVKVSNSLSRVKIKFVSAQDIRTEDISDISELMLARSEIFSYTFSMDKTFLGADNEM